jgi:hypothetical protein
MKEQNKGMKGIEERENVRDEDTKKKNNDFPTNFNELCH